ncbi:unnamed protein product [Didymodactylos carnosus]|uniref:Uncharacterized protein n=1 Tax=Didymodactylos carnosus TaxID=1234261 RepID=A0A813QVK0_9BILA|nr:unnamed protein product [Didymodactylos carnosus]CAF0907979.1 unnamed protein product [Didymodactylos carnosus]CAF3556352.1 unnamed protein product [Didymodactylos carnosus]CAF3687508.1 unnamed protein product [Didymodactylos carnosus]
MARLDQAGSTKVEVCPIHHANRSARPVVFPGPPGLSPTVASIMKLTTQTKSEIGVLWYRDYDQSVDKVTGFSGRGDVPEAIKTALNKALEMNLVDLNTIIFIYTDAPPHHPTTHGTCCLCNAEYESTDVVKCLDFINVNVFAFDNEVNAQYKNLIYLPNRFKQDDTYKSVVYQVVESLMIPQHVVALTHNSILGLLWRLVCEQRKDERRDKLMSTLSRTLNTMDSDQKLKTDAIVVRKWLAKSYNSKDEIKAIIAEVKEQVPALVLILDQKMNRIELMEITRSCNPQVLRTVMTLLNHLTVVTNVSNLPQTYLPLGIDDDEIFKLLPHLLARGLRVSLRPASIMAMLCILSKNNILQQRAERFLTSVKGKWIDLDLPENYVYTFSKMCIKLPQFFTENENLLFQKLYIVGGLRLNAVTHVTAKQPFSPKVTEIRKDTKIKCTPESCTEDESRLVQCKTCTSLYAVVQYYKLASTPKCYYCRELKISPYRRCTGCNNKYVHYDSTEPIANNGEEYTFLCAECEYYTTDKTIVDIPVSISTLINDNKTQIFKYLNIKIKNDIDLFSTEWSLFKLKDKIELENIDDVKLLSLSSLSTPLIHNQKPILNSSAVLDKIYTWVLSGKSEYVTCYICCNDLPRDKINNTCGNKLCNADACIECLTKWYQAVKPGGIVLVTYLLCPFCKHAPSGKILKKYNKQACTILKPDKKNDIDEHWYYGWCIDCYKVKQAQEKICSADGSIPVLTDFVCDNCAGIRKSHKNSVIKDCPGINENTKKVCGVATLKSGGCNHITCTACNSY